MPETPRQPTDLSVEGYHTAPSHDFSRGVVGKNHPSPFQHTRLFLSSYTGRLFYLFRQSSEQAALWEQFIHNTLGAKRRQRLAFVSSVSSYFFSVVKKCRFGKTRDEPAPRKGSPMWLPCSPLYGFDPHDGTETARTPWLHGDDLIRSIRAPLPKAAGLVDLSRVTNFLNDPRQMPGATSQFVIRHSKNSSFPKDIAMKTNSEKFVNYYEQTSKYSVKWAKSRKLLEAQLLTYNTGKALHQQLRSAHQALAEKLLYLYSVALHYHQAYVGLLIPGTTPLPALRVNNVQLSQMLNCSERTVQNLRQRLRTAGIITREVWHGTNSQYELFLSPQVLHLQLGGDPNNQVAQFFATTPASLISPQAQTLRHTVTSKTILETNKLNKLSGADCQQAPAPELGAESDLHSQPLDVVAEPEELVENPQSDSVLDTALELFSGYETTSDTPTGTTPPVAAAPPKSSESPKRRRRPLPKVTPQVPEVPKVVNNKSSEAAPNSPTREARNRRVRRDVVVNQTSSEAAPSLTLPTQFPLTLESVYLGLSAADRLQLDRQVSRMASVVSTVLYADQWIHDQEYNRLRIALAEYLRYAPAANYTRGANEVVERIHLVRRWIDSGLANGQNRWVPLPSLYFDVRNDKGFKATKAWFKKHQQAKIAIKDRELVTKAVNFYLASLRPEATIAPTEAYRRVTQTLGKRKASLVQLFQQEIQNSVPHVQQHRAA